MMRFAMESQTPLYPSDVIATEQELLAVSRALASGAEDGRRVEDGAGAPGGGPDRGLLALVRRSIEAGEDPLGDAFMALRSADRRRASGATYTPRAIVGSMVDWAEGEGQPERVVDPGCGSGRFILAAARRFPHATLVAVDSDPVAVAMLRANARVLGIQDRLTVSTGDYRAVDLPRVRGRTLFIGNPPYLRHHEIEPAWKQWFAVSAAAHDVDASKLAGLHMHFFLRTLQLARVGDVGCFVTSSEWLDVNYGSALRRLLADGLGGVSIHVLRPTALPFAGTQTTGAITCFRVGQRPRALVLRAVDSVDSLQDLRDGREVSWQEVEGASRWSPLLRPRKRPAAGSIELGELFRAHRGQVTGSNAVWIAGAYGGDLPERYLVPTVTRARELLAVGDVLRNAGGLRRVIDLPEDLDVLDEADRRKVEGFLRWARDRGAATGYVATHRGAWWSVGLRRPAAILVTYMARRAPAFVVNGCAARHINVAHGLYPKVKLSDAQIDSIANWLREHVTVEDGRTYAGGLTKFEPKEIERLRVPPLEELDGSTARLVATGS